MDDLDGRRMDCLDGRLWMTWMDDVWIAWMDDVWMTVGSLHEMKQGQCICPLSWSVHCNFTGDGKCNKRRWACTPRPHQPRLILPS
jgi:hypothetical protein